MLLMTAFSLGVGLIVATLGVFFHDFRVAYQVLLTGWLYATPIIYPIEILPERVLLQPGNHQQVLVRAHYSDGRTEDVTRWAKFTSTKSLIQEMDTAVSTLFFATSTSEVVSIV